MTSDGEPEVGCDCEQCRRFAEWMEQESKRVEAWARALIHIAEHVAAKKQREAN